MQDVSGLKANELEVKISCDLYSLVYDTVSSSLNGNHDYDFDMYYYWI